MSKILLLDFKDTDPGRLLEAGFEAELRTTGFREGDSQTTILTEDCETVFVRANGETENGRSPVSLTTEILPFIEKGGRVVCFAGKGRTSRLTSVIGVYPELNLQDGGASEGFLIRPESPLGTILDRFRSSVVQTILLLQNRVADASWDMDSASGDRFEILAKDASGRPLSMLIRRGKGFSLILPWFDERNIDVAAAILKDGFPKLDAEAGVNREAGWLDGPDYMFPVLAELYAEREKEKARHEQAVLDIEKGIHEARALEQEPFTRLLTSEGADLKEAVILTLKHFGWNKVIDVDAYWKNVIRNKEEDLWLLESEQPVETGLRRDALILVLVRANKNWATDDECAIIQKFKGRRMQEFDNTRMKAVLIGNYFMTQEAKLRNRPYSALQIEEARKDGNLLITTYDLFKAVKAEKEGRIRKDEIRDWIGVETGCLEIDEILSGPSVS